MEMKISEAEYLVLIRRIEDLKAQAREWKRQLRFGPMPQFVDIRNSAGASCMVRHVGGSTYFRDAGHWYVTAKWVRHWIFWKRLLVVEGPTEGMAGIPLIPVTEKEYTQDNVGYYTPSWLVEDSTLDADELAW